MKCFTMVLTVLIAFAINTNAQIPNSGFENWTTVGSYENPTDWFTGNSEATFLPATKSSDHYPMSVGNYSIRLENQFPLVDMYSYGFAATTFASCSPSFPITGHPTSFCGYYKCFPLNTDTVQIGIMLYKDGVWVAGAQQTSTVTVSNWTSFNVPISSYTEADSAYIAIAAFFNDTNCGFPYGPFGNSVLYVDNLSFDNLITSIPDLDFRNITFSLFPNPANDIVNIEVDNTNKVDLTLNIYNVIGTLVKSVILRQNQEQINVEDLSNGIYMIEIKSDDRTENQKLIIQR
jgi:hypothetical protein